MHWWRCEWSVLTRLKIHADIFIAQIFHWAYFKFNVSKSSFFNQSHMWNYWFKVGKCSSHIVSVRNTENARRALMSSRFKNKWFRHVTIDTAIVHASQPTIDFLFHSICHKCNVQNQCIHLSLGHFLHVVHQHTKVWIFECLFSQLCAVTLSQSRLD